MKRRDFVQRLPVLTTGIAMGATLPLSACAGAPYLTPRVTPSGLSVPLAAIDAGGAFVQSAEMERPIWLARDAGGEVVALLASCTHQGCQPEPVGDRLICPCHGSEFSLSGEVLEGPAERPLTRYAVTVGPTEVTIRTSGGDR